MKKRYKIAAFIQARMASKRLPGKVLLDIEGQPTIMRVVNNLRPSKYIDDVIIVTAKGKDNDPIVERAKKEGIRYFRGDEINVVKRYVGAAKKFNADIVVRATGDCPLISYEISDYLIKSHLKSEADYTGVQLGTVPIGTFSEIINFSALKKLITSKIDLSYGEYMSFYFRNNPQYFSLNIISGPKEFYRPDYRLTLDYPEDLELIRSLYRGFVKKSKAIPLTKTLTYLDNHPEISSKNKKMKLKWKDDKKFLGKLIKLTKIK